MNCTMPANGIVTPSSVSTVFTTQPSPPCESTVLIFTLYSS